MTPAQVRGKVAGVQRDRRKWSLHNAWHSESFQRTKGLKKLEDYLGEKRFQPTARERPKDMMRRLREQAKAQKERAQKKRARESADG
jgi:hypothetical protein